MGRTDALLQQPHGGVHLKQQLPNSLVSSILTLLKNRQKRKKTQTMYQLDMVIHAYNPSIWKTEVGSSGGQGQPGLHSETHPPQIYVANRQELQQNGFWEGTNLKVYPLTYS